MRRRRGGLDIIEDILSVVIKGAGKTAITYQTNMNFARADGYITNLLRSGLITATEGSSTRYEITEKGLKCLEMIRDIKQMTGLGQLSSESFEMDLPNSVILKRPANKSPFYK